MHKLLEHQRQHRPWQGAMQCVTSLELGATGLGPDQTSEQACSMHRWIMPFSSGWAADDQAVTKAVDAFLLSSNAISAFLEQRLATCEGGVQRMMNNIMSWLTCNVYGKGMYSLRRAHDSSGWCPDPIVTFLIYMAMHCKCENA